MRVPSSSSGSLTTSQSGMPMDPSLASGKTSTRRVPAWWPSVLSILASTWFSTWKSRPSRRTCETPMSRSTCTGSQSGSSSGVRLLMTSRPSSSQRCRRSRIMKTRFSRVSRDHSKSWTPSRMTAAETFTKPCARSLSSQCIFVSRRCGRCSSAAMRFASFTSGIATISCSSSFCMLSSSCRWSSSSAAAFFDCRSSSSMRCWAASSALRWRSSNSRCRRSSSRPWMRACSAAAAWSLACAWARSCSSRSQSSCFRTIWALNSSSRLRSSSSACSFAWLLASSASRARRSSSSASSRLAFSSSSEGMPPICSLSSFLAAA
mmetsp:Transcript_30491/g.97453  ORF Transcript_30491/g.97453 Transcript_30491/m.97453 type:complete len:320 (-) Transcript_30491:781-1740(-)